MSFESFVLLGFGVSVIGYVISIGVYQLLYYYKHKRNISVRNAQFKPKVIILSISLDLVIFALIFFLNNQSINSTHVYPEESIEGFTKGCTLSLKAQQINTTVAENICSCSIDETQRVYTFGEFSKIMAEAKKTYTLPEQYKNIMTSCTEKYLKD